MTSFFFFLKTGAAYIVHSYAKKLENEKSWRSGPGAAPLHDTSKSTYTHVQQQDHHGAHIPLTGITASYDYPYSGANHSFGGTKPHHHAVVPV